MMDGTDLVRLCDQQGWSRARLMLELRRAARRKKRGLLPDDPSLKRMIREWAHGRRGLSADYADLFAEVFGVPFAVGKGAAAPTPATPPAETDLAARLTAAEALDASLVSLLEAQTQSFRTLDRQLGAARLLQQTEAHIGQMADLWRYALPGPHRTALAAALAEGAALAGWQALDLGDPDKAWALHETAKAAARDSEDVSIIAHVTAQQAYALLDLDRPASAVTLIQHARREADGKVPGQLRSWLWAAEAEALAAAGAATEAQTALDNASDVLAAHGKDDSLPFLFLDEVHLARWRGHSLARLGKAAAVQELTDALNRLDPTFTRAAAGLRVDLAQAYSVRGQHEEARTEARAAEVLATRASSERQRRRIAKLLKSGAEPSGR